MIRAATVAVLLPASLLRLFPGCPALCHVLAGSVGDLLDALDRDWPGLRDRLCDSRAALRRHIRVFVDGEPADLATRLAPGAEMVVMTAIGGG